MKAVLQRVVKSSVSVEGTVISTIGRGLMVLIGIHKDDTQQDIDFLVRKILNVRLFEDGAGKRWDKSVTDLNLEILCVSQFTLYYSLKGNKPDFRHSMKTDESRTFYDQFLRQLRNSYKPELVKDGKFGAMMEVNIVNDGPVTIEIESPKKLPPGEQPIPNDAQAC